MVKVHARPGRLRSFLILGVLLVLSVSATDLAAAEASVANLWVSRYDGPASGVDVAHHLAVGPGGSRVYATGESRGSVSGLDYATVAYDATTGDEVWAERYDGPKGVADVANAVAVSPDGSTVFVTGGSKANRIGWDYATVAYDAATGAQQWVARFDGVGHEADRARALGVSPDGSTVFVTGSSTGRTNDGEYATVAYDAATGAQLWARRYQGSVDVGDFSGASDLGVSPDGSAVFVTGRDETSFVDEEYATVAYDATTGARLWVARYSGAEGTNYATALGVSPDGSAVFVTGTSHAGSGANNYATVAYDAATGAERWVARYAGPPGGSDHAAAIGVSPDGSAVFVTGDSVGSTGFDFATLAYDAATGARLWVQRYDGPASGNDIATALGVSHDGSTVFVTGQSKAPSPDFDADYATLAYDATTGAKVWAKRYHGHPDPVGEHSIPSALGVSPDGSAVFVTGTNAGSTTDADYATVAYGPA